RGMAHVGAFEGLDDVEIVGLCDVDADVLGGRCDEFAKKTGRSIKRYADLRRVLDDKDVDVVTTATPNHWHALVGVWAMQAGKDVYIEKPISHNVSEGRRLIEAADKYQRLCQHGTQNRGLANVQEAMKFLHDGGIGKVHLAKGLCYKWRPSIGKRPDAAPPTTLDWNQWQGPAAERNFSRRFVHYDWHWNWEYGNGDIGNQGVHQLDVARWGLGKNVHPNSVVSFGGRFGYEDDGVTPNTQTALYDYGDCQMQFEVRGLPTNDESGVRVGNIFYGSEGYLVLAGSEWKTFFGKNNEPGKSMAGSNSEQSHFAAFAKAVRSRKNSDLTASAVEGHFSSTLGHLANIAYRVGRKLNFDPKTETFGSDEEANRLLTREYRAPFVMPKIV
ncbi:MAG: Gfo/Idh/MocA family protein, partial [Planctomycetia bacterium]